MNPPEFQLPVPKGLSFEIDDLAAIRSWADSHDVIMSVRLDHGAVGEEYEEVIAFHTRLDPMCRLIIWRDAASVFIQPLIGVRRRYGSVGDALDGVKLSYRCIMIEISTEPTIAVK